MRQKFVVEVVDEEKAPKTRVVIPVAVENIPEKQKEHPLPRPQHREEKRREVVDILDKSESIEREFQKERINEIRETPSIESPEKVKKETISEPKTSHEQAFLRSFEKQKPIHRIEEYYQKSSRYQSSRPEKKEPSWWKIQGKRVVQWLFDSGEEKSNSWVSTVFLFLMVVILLLGGLGAIVYQDVQHIKREGLQTISALQNLQFREAKESLEFLESRQKRYTQVYSKAEPVLAFFLPEKQERQIAQVFEISRSGLEIVRGTTELYDRFELAYRQFLGEEEGESIATFSQVSGRLEGLFTDLSKLQTQLQSADELSDFDLVTSANTRISENLPAVRKSVLAAQQLSQALPDLLGQKEKRQYLVLLQNNAELRATGGFIGSFGILTVENGRFVDFRVEDVYEADGQLNGYVTPPPELVEFLGEAQWWLRDVNWSADFPTVAKQAGWFLDKEMNIKPDGVIGINLEVAKKLLDVTGPIQLVDYDEVITRDNLYERAQMHSEMNFFPGSTQKRDFLSAVARAIFDKITKADVDKVRLLRALYESATESEMLVSVNNTEAENALANLGWTGSVLSPECPGLFAKERCFVDTAMQVEANVGVNKANQYISREISDSIEVTATEAKHHRVVRMKNSADSNAWPEGAYKAYFRLLVPKDAQLSEIMVDNQKIDVQKVRETQELEKKSIGFPVNVGISSIAIISLKYSVPIPAEKQGVYAFFEQKQPGAGADPLEVSLKILGRKVVTVAPAPKIEGDEYQFSTDRKKHRFVVVELK